MIALFGALLWLCGALVGVSLTRMARRPTPAPTFSALDSPEDVKLPVVLAAGTSNPDALRSA